LLRQDASKCLAALLPAGVQATLSCYAGCIRCLHGRAGKDNTAGQQWDSAIP
jgi:hypothetical protein